MILAIASFLPDERRKRHAAADGLAEDGQVGHVKP
jgi:hypothetical protein